MSGPASPLPAWRDGPTLAAVGEAALLARLARMLRAPGEGVLRGVGDDAAVLAASQAPSVWTVDTLVEDVDFRRRWATPTDVGHKAAAVNLSDLAAMGARPRALLVSVAAHRDTPARAVLALARAVDRVGRAHGAPLVGGDLSGTRGPVTVTVTALGAASAGRVLERGGGRLGDLVAVTGHLGAGAAGLALLEAGRPGSRALKRAQLRPAPQVACGLALAALPVAAVRSCVDVSDGLAADGPRLVGPGLAVVLHPDVLPLAIGLERYLPTRQARRLALSGGEDFVLALAFAPARRAEVAAACVAAGAQLHVVGEFLDARRAPRGVRPGKAEFVHFASW